MKSFYETRSSLKIDVTDTMSFERPTSENNAKGDVALRNAETINIRESVIVSRSETFDNDTKKRHEKDDLTCANLQLNTSQLCPEKKLDNIADAILAEEEKRLDIFGEEPIEDSTGLEVDEGEMGSARGQTTEEDPIENNGSEGKRRQCRRSRRSESESGGCW